MSQFARHQLAQFANMSAEPATTRLLPAGRRLDSGSAGSGDAAQTVVAPADRTLASLQRGVLLTLASLALLTAVRLSFITGLWTPVTIDGPSMAPALLGARYDLTCGDCRFRFSRDAEGAETEQPGIVVCPNCGFVDGAAELGEPLPGQRVLIDRWPHVGREPQRGEIVAARLPGSPDELVVKRIAAIGPAELTIEGGDLYSNGRIVRKSIQELRSVRQLVHDNDFRPPARGNLPPRWQSLEQDSVWRAAGAGFVARPLPADDDGSFDWLEYHHWMCTAMPRPRSEQSLVRDYDPYNAGGAREMNVVRDLVITCRVRAEGYGRFALAVTDGSDRFEAVFHPGDKVVVQRNAQALAEIPLALNLARRGVELEFGLCDQQVLLAVAGRTIVRQTYERTDGPHRDVLHPLAIGAGGPALEVSRLRVWRDIYYLEPRRTPGELSAVQPLAAGHYLLLGDNQPASYDGRTWEAGVPRSAILGRVTPALWQ